MSLESNFKSKWTAWLNGGHNGIMYLKAWGLGILAFSDMPHWLHSHSFHSHSHTTSGESSVLKLI